MTPSDKSRCDTSKAIRFRFSPAKARAAIQWMLKRASPLDLHIVLRTCYFADRNHINYHNRPVFGATYRALNFGPFPVKIHEMAKSDPLWLAELEADQFPWILQGYHLHPTADEPAHFGCLSQSDIDALEHGFELARSMTFTSRTAATHGHDWQVANLGIMRYEDMIDDFEGKGERVANLRDIGSRMKI
jgi:hypothetical protein